MRRVVQMPLLMANGMAVAEYGEKQVPSALTKQLIRYCALLGDTAAQSIEQSAVLVNVAQTLGAEHIVVRRKTLCRVGIDSEDRMQAKGGFDVRPPD